MEFTKIEVVIIKKVSEMINDVEHGYVTQDEFNKDIELFKKMAGERGVSGVRFESLVEKAVIEASRVRHGAKTFIWN